MAQRARALPAADACASSRASTRTRCACACAARATSPTPARGRYPHERQRHHRRTTPRRARTQPAAEPDADCPRARASGVRWTASRGGSCCALLRAHPTAASSSSSRATERMRFGEVVPERPLRAVLHVRSPRFYRAMLRGSVGLGESYMEGMWDCEDLVALTRIAALNVGGLDRLRRRFAARADPDAALGALARAQHAGALAQAHRSPLRPRQRALLAVPRPHDDVLLRGLRRARHDARGGLDGQARAHLRRSSTCAPTITCSRSAPAGAASRCTPPRATAAASRRRRSRANSTPTRPSASARPASRIA